MIEIIEKSKCTGCNACVNCCPKQCINMVKDEEGFWYPLVKKKECIDCGLCEKICPLLSKIQEVQFQKFFAAYSKNSYIRLESSSGGIFSLLAKHVLENGGVVFGAAFNEELQVEHIYVDRFCDLGKLRMSKYVQSSIGNTFKIAKDFLESGKIVLFTGTPCQIAGLKSFLHKDYDNLYTHDIICFGVPSPLVWLKNIEVRQKFAESKIKSIQFRNKNIGWTSPCMKYEYYSGISELFPNQEDYSYKAFINRLSMRPSCYECVFKGKHHYSDLTLADFWDVEKVVPNMNDDLGTSLLICNNKKGSELLQNIYNKTVIKEVECSQAVKGNPAYLVATPKPYTRTLFFKYLQRHDLKQTVDLFCGQDEKSVKRVQLMVDYQDVKKERGIVFSFLWKMKNLKNYT